MTTNEHIPGRRSRNADRRAGRTRIVAWIVGVTGMGLTILVLGASFALRATVAADIATALEQESGELRRFSAEAVDPDTGDAFATAQDFIATYLRRQEPSASEILVGASLVGGDAGSAPMEPVARSGRLAPALGDLDPASKAAVLQPSSSGTRTTAAHGRISWRNLEVQAPDGNGYMAIIEFHRHSDEELLRQIALLVILALSALAATGIAAWVVSGRILLPVDRFERLALSVAAGSGEKRLPERGSDVEVRLARAANALNSAAERAVEREEQFSDDLAHGIRTPLAILRGTVEQPGSTPEQQSVSRQRVLGELRQLEALVDHLVVLNRVDRPGFFSITDGVQVEAFTRDFVASWGTRVGPRVELGEAAAIAAPIDEPRLAEALDELVANALHASDGSEPVTVSSLVVSAPAADGAGEPEAAVRFTVTDSGRGIPELDRETVLERFGRASNDPDPGEGIGLTVAARLVGGMGGRLTLVPRADGPGTTAGIDLPLTTADATR